jgi:hypothetical protein
MKPWPSWNTGAVSSSTPADLAVAFRSLARRLRNAQNDQTPPQALSAAERDIAQALTGAATVVNSAATADAVATAIEGRRSSDWSSAELSALQGYADAGARAIRQVENLTERA